MNKVLDWLKAFGWLLLEFIIYVIITATIAGLFSLLAYKIMDPPAALLANEELIQHPFLMLVLEYVPLFIGSIVALYTTHTVIFKRDFSLTGIVPDSVGSEFGAGYLLAFMMLLSGFLALWIPGALSVDKISWNGLLFTGYLIFFLIQSSFEEIVTRAFMIPSISARFNTIIALIVSSSIFSIFHIFNPSISIVSIINIFLAGLLMGLLFLKTNKIWAPIGLHAGWNFLQGSFFGFEVSGFDVYSLIDTEETGADLITGGAFGFEGSLIATLFLGALSLWIIYSSPDILKKSFNTIGTDTSEDIAGF